MKKVYIIHENTKPIKVGERYIQIATDYVCTVGYIEMEDEKDPNEGSEYEPVYMYKTKGSLLGEANVELNNFIPGEWFETYEQGIGALAKILKVRTTNDINILSTYNGIAEKYPEALI